MEGKKSRNSPSIEFLHTSLMSTTAHIQRYPVILMTISWLQSRSTVTNTDCLHEMAYTEWQHRLGYYRQLAALSSVTYYVCVYMCGSYKHCTVVGNRAANMMRAIWASRTTTRITMYYTQHTHAHDESSSDWLTDITAVNVRWPCHGISAKQHLSNTWDDMSSRWL